jgi:hypothetical protein
MSQPAGAGARAEEPATGWTPLDRALLAISGFLFAFIACYASIKNINWDEFFFLSHIYSVARGEAIQPLQTFYVHLFGWLPGLGGNEISQIMAARAVFVLLLGLSMFFLYRISRHFFSRTAALFAVATGLSVTNVINHGPSFRFDTLTLVLVMFTAFALLKSDLRWWLAAAISTALAMLVTIKTVFFLPAFLAIALLAGSQEKWSRAFLARAAVSALTAILVYGGLFLLHLSLLGFAAAGGAAESAEMLVHAGGKTLGEGILLPRLPTLMMSLTQNSPQWAIILVGVLMAGLALRHRNQSRGEWGRALVVLALALPLFTPLIYRNAFAYFYVMIIPPAAIATGYFVEAYRARAGQAGGGSARLLILAPLVIALVMNAGHYLGRLYDQRIAQIETIELVHALFPQPVPYIDRNGMISSFPRVGFFMSSWGVENYRNAGRPVMQELLHKEAPVFLLANTVLLGLRSGGGADLLEERYQWLDEDLATLKDNFVHFWGILYLAGKRFDFAGERSQSFEILLPGPYTLEAGGALTIDGTELAPGAVITLSKGAHRIEASADTASATLIYGENPVRPTTAWSQQPIYTGL